jgi:hypothetical protein
MSRHVLTRWRERLVRHAARLSLRGERQVRPLAIAAALGLALSACGVTPSPEGAARAWFNALSTFDEPSIRAMTCRAEQSNVLAPAVLARLRSSGAQLTLQGPSFTLRRVAVDAADVEVTATLSYAVYATSENRPLDTVLRMRMEDGEWKYCGETGPAALAGAPPAGAVEAASAPATPSPAQGDVDLTGWTVNDSVPSLWQLGSPGRPDKILRLTAATPINDTRLVNFFSHATPLSASFQATVHLRGNPARPGQEFQFSLMGAQGQTRLAANLTFNGLPAAQATGSEALAAAQTVSIPGNQPDVYLQLATQASGQTSASYSSDGKTWTPLGTLQRGAAWNKIGFGARKDPGDEAAYNVQVLSVTISDRAP